MSDYWPPIRVKRFSGESLLSYEQRRAEIVAIISGFRKGRFKGPIADRLDIRLDELQNGDFDDTRFDPHGIVPQQAALAG